LVETEQWQGSIFALSPEKGNMVTEMVTVAQLPSSLAFRDIIGHIHAEPRLSQMEQL